MAIDNDVLSEIVTRELQNAETWMGSELADQQANNLKYYFAGPFGNEKKGRSQIVTRDVLETVEGIMPELMKIFASSDSVVEFEPVGPEDEEAAAQATDYVNHVFMKRLDGFKLMYNWFKDSLLMKYSVIKVGWNEEDIVEFHPFDNISKEELKVFEDNADEEEYAIESKTKNEDGSFRVRIRRTKKQGEPFIDIIPSEEFRIKERSKDIQSAGFVGHVCQKSIGELLEAGVDPDLLPSGGAEMGIGISQQVADARFSDPVEGLGSTFVGSVVDEDQLVEVADVYVRTFDQEEGRVVIMHVIQVEGEVILSEEVDHIPLIGISPIMIPHKFVGVSAADLVTDIQELRSTMIRQILDNLALQNAGRYSIIEGQVNIQDLLDNKIGGIVRTKAQNAVTPLATPQISAATFPLLDSLDLQKENRTGVSRMTQGLDPNALTSNTAATAVNQVMTAAQGKILLIARVFAETGMKPLLWELYRQIRTHQTEADIVKLRGRFVEVAPFDWIDRKDMTVTVGIGNGNKDQQLYHLNNLSQMMQQIGATPYSYLISPDNVHALATEFIKNAGFKNPDRFITNPDQAEQPEDKPTPEEIIAQATAAKAQADAESDSAKNELAALKQQLDRDKFEWTKKVEAAELAVEAEQGRAVGIGDK
jgi:hypothetical protein